jgi:protein-tyrosine-phosphatase
LRIALEGLSAMSAPPQRKAGAAGGAVRLRPQFGPLADGGGAVRPDRGARRYVGSAGVRKGELDPFAVAVMTETGIDIARHRPATFEELEDWEGLNFDLIVTLAPEAHHKALELTRTVAAEVEYWPMPDPTAVEGSREQRLSGYRELRDLLAERIRARFGGSPPVNR